MNDPKKHHYIPVFYLKAWCGKDGRLAQFRRVGPGGKKLFRKWVFPTETGYKPFLYTLPNLEQADRNWLEDVFLNLIDTNSAVARDKLIALEDIKSVPLLRDAWSRFIMSSIHRNPEKIAEIARAWNEGHDKITQSLEPRYDLLRSPRDPPNFESYVASQTPASRERSFAKLLKSIMDSERVGTALNTMSWGVWWFPHTVKTLMTSDRPIVMPNGLAHENSFVGVALGPRHLFIACNNKRMFESFVQTNGGEKVAAFHNDIITKQAKDFVYAQNHSAEPFVKRRLGHHPPQYIG